MWTLVGVFLLSSFASGERHTEKELTAFLNGPFENQSSATCTAQNIASWNYETNLNEENSNKIMKVTLKSSKEEKLIYDKWFKDVRLRDITNATVRRQLEFEKTTGSTALNETDLKELTKIDTKMTDIYSTAKVCPYKKQGCDKKSEGLSLEPDIDNVMSTSRDYDELTYVWQAWRDETGRKMKDDYGRYVELSNKAAVLNGFKNNAEYWMNDYEMPNLEEQVDRLWAQVKPFYDKLHAYARKALIKYYGPEIFGNDDLTPANLFGNMWAQSWVNIGSILKPFPQEIPVNVTEALRKQGYTPMKMFETANQFYTSLGLPSNNVSYGSDSMIVRPKDREVTCHASAWDFCDRKTFRIKMCTEVNYEYFVTIHHEMGHIQYYQLYKNQPFTFRDGANPGFHEAIGDTIALSVGTPKHLVTIGLLENYEPTEGTMVNTLMDVALEKIAFLPFGLLVDKWRWEVFAGNISQDQWNDVWWQYRKDYQKMKPPVARTQADFDPGAKYHVPADSQYINYFIAAILEFQLYRSFCVTAGEYDPETKEQPLHNCDFFNNKKVGDKLKAGLSMGKSKHWSEVLKVMTDESELDASAILEYFEPLSKYLDEQAASAGVIKAQCATLVTTVSVSLLLLFIGLTILKEQ